MRLGRLDPRSEADTIAKLELDRNALRIEVGTLEQRRSLLNARRANAEQTLAQLNSAIPLLVERGGGGALRPVTVTAQPREGEDLKAAILRVRSQINNNNSEITRLRTAPCTADEIRAAAIPKVEQMAAQGAPHIASANGTVEIRFPDEPQFADPGAVMSAPSGSASKMLAWLFPEQMLARMTDGLDDVVGGVSKAEREARSTELNAEVRELEHEEEALVCMALEAGLDVHRRPTASPLALLGLEVEQQAALLQAAE
jgi:hypothetical protein